MTDRSFPAVFEGLLLQVTSDNLASSSYVHLADLSATMDAAKLGKQLLELCSNDKSLFAEVQKLLESLTDEDQRREVVRYMDEVGESSGAADSLTILIYML